MGEEIKKLLSNLPSIELWGIPSEIWYAIIIIAVLVLIWIAAQPKKPPPKPEREKTGSYDGMTVYVDGCDYCDPNVTVYCLRTDRPRGEYHIAQFCPICGKRFSDPHQ